MNSLESIMSIMSGNSIYMRNIKVCKENCIYSKELARDIKRIKNAKSLEALVDLSENLEKEYYGFEAFTNLMLCEFEQGAASYEMLNSRYGTEAAGYYLRSLEEEANNANAAAGANNAATNADGGEKTAKTTDSKAARFFKKLWDGIKKMASKMASMAMNFVKIITNALAKFAQGGAAKLAENFDAANFKNVDAKVNLPPLPDWAKKGTVPAEDKEMENISQQDAPAILQKFGNDVKNAEKKAFQQVWNADKRPDKKETTVGQYLGVSAGADVPAVKLLKKETLQTLETNKKVLMNNAKKAKDVMNKINKDQRESMNSGNKEVVKQKIAENKNIMSAITALNRYAYVQFQEQLAVRSCIMTAVKMGLKAVKKNKSEGDNNANTNKDQNTAPTDNNDANAK